MAGSATISACPTSRSCCDDLLGLRAQRRVVAGVHPHDDRLVAGGQLQGFAHQIHGDLRRVGHFAADDAAGNRHGHLPPRAASQCRCQACRDCSIACTAWPRAFITDCVCCSIRLRSEASTAFSAACLPSSTAWALMRAASARASAMILAASPRTRPR